VFIDVNLGKEKGK